ncbi:hypothetical protein PROFUN_16459, partial [Planoprotostelium fungivorum]
NRHPPLQLENLNLLISQQRQSYQAERNGAPNPKHVIPTTRTAKRKADQTELQELVVIEDDDSELNHPPSNSPESSRSASSTIKELLLWCMFNESLFIKNDNKPKEAKFSLTFLQVFQLVNDVKCWAQQLQAGEARIQELSDQLKREQNRVDLLKKGATTFGEEFIFGSFFC